MSNDFLMISICRNFSIPFQKNMCLSWFVFIIIKFEKFASCDYIFVRYFFAILQDSNKYKIFFIIEFFLFKWNEEHVFFLQFHNWKMTRKAMKIVWNCCWVGRWSAERKNTYTSLLEHNRRSWQCRIPERYATHRHLTPERRVVMVVPAIYGQRASTREP